jgi:hypothetical protein
MEKQRKTIQINPDFFKIGKRTRKQKQAKKRSDLRQTIKPNNLKKQLLTRIKNHQQEHEKNKQSDTDNLDKFQNDFNSSLNYLQTMIKQKKEKKRKRTRKKKEKITSVAPPQAPIINTQPFTQAPGTDTFIQQPPQLVQTKSNDSVALPYGCLKNGTKPTYSQYMKTLKKTNAFKKPTLVLPPKPPPTIEVLERKEKLNKLKETMALPKKETILQTINRKRTIKIFKLGKKGGKVGVLVKSGKTRKKIREEHKILHSKCILEVKRYLRKHNLIKAGTAAPENILRKLYEDSFLAGDIYNKNADILLHNYIQDDN